MGKNNRKKQGAFFKAFSRSPHSISRTFELAVPMKKPSCFLNIKGSFLHISVVKLVNSFQLAFEDAATILTGIKCKYVFMFSFQYLAEYLRNQD